MKNLLIFFLFVPISVWSQSNFEKAEKLFHAKKHEEAQLIFERVLESKPSDIKTLEYLGEIASHAKSWVKAAEYFKKLKELKPNEADYFYKYGGALAMRAMEVNKFKALGMVDDMKEAFERAIVLEPKHIPARWALIEIYLQLPSIVGGSESKAISFSNQLLQISAVDGYLSRGRIEEYFKRYTLAEKYYLKANEIGKSKVTFQKLYNLYLNKLKDPKKAQELKRKFEA
ncbi:MULTISPECIES: tetratricopeptide repeat protein [Flavobacterium]|uniref:Tetratricopeptide repeat protein n=2 Tax=Flavobacterium TaxID=237 RepID=A0A941AZT3_9FLAO|nr:MULTISPECIES: tetratricopeptide repeat protein [Flavobacterium]MBP4139347.1 tetratricopeptide repeat protein [Flavobacterium geliluteum]MDX6182135.1 tetratricopeptide repeat protein [Flavobacterium sp. Fl-33]MDX6185952.1 tetratricopeptide repeat protein [Flavobacterium sp. Fl-77]UFH39128.1 tetratricopeptide repeat protein [Flavobacterium sp. F-70]